MAAVQQWDVIACSAPSDRDADALQHFLGRLAAQLAAELGPGIPHRKTVQPPTAAPRMLSLYAHCAEGGEPEITTYTAKFQATIDYIFALEGSLPLGRGEVLCDPVPTKAQLGGPIPSKTEPSDHLPLCVQLSV